MRAALVKLINYIYIDSEEHHIISYSRAYRGFLPFEDMIKTTFHRKTDKISSADYEDLFGWFMRFINKFGKNKQTLASVLSSPLVIELLKLSNYTLKFGIFNIREGGQKEKDLGTLFGFLCFILDIFTNRIYANKVSALERILSQDTVSQ